MSPFECNHPSHYCEIERSHYLDDFIIRCGQCGFSSPASQALRVSADVIYRRLVPVPPPIEPSSYEDADFDVIDPKALTVPSLAIGYKP